MIAVDTNILIYVYDTRDPARQARAVEVVAGLPDGVLLWQVACEFLAASRRLADQGWTHEHAFAALSDLRSLMPLVDPGPGAIERAKAIMAGGPVQFWDALIYGACLDAGVQTLLSEDLPGRAIPGLSIRDPLA